MSPTLAAQTATTTEHSPRPRSRRITGALLPVGTAIALSAVPATPAAAATSGSETVKGVIVSSGASGTATVVSSVIIARGVFNGVGRFAPRPPQPGDAPNVSRADLIYSVGTMHLVATTVGAKFSADPRSCLFNFTVQQNAMVVGGTGQFAAASGTFTQTVTGVGLQARNADGSCSATKPAVREVDTVAGSGTLSF